MHLIKEQLLEDSPPSAVIDVGRDALATDTKSKKGIIGSQPKGNHNLKDPNGEVFEKTETTWARCRINLRNAWMGLHFLQNSELITAEHNNPWQIMEN